MKRPAMQSPRLVRVLLGLLVFAHALSAQAMDPSSKEAVRVLANDGAVDFENGRYESALGKFERAYASARVPTLSVWVAETHERLGHLVQAQEYYRQALTLESNDLWLGSVQQQAQQRARDRLLALQPRIPKLVIHIEGADEKDIRLEIDGIMTPIALLGAERPIDPGTRIVTGRLKDKVVEQSIELSEGELRQLWLKFPPNESGQVRHAAVLPSEPTEALLRAPASNTQRHLAWVGLGVGALGLVFGASTAIYVAKQHDRLREECPNGECGRSHWSEVDSYERMRTMSTACLLGGAVIGVAGVALLLTSPTSQSAQVGLLISPNATGIRGEF
jgi:hypothetical protein